MDKRKSLYNYLKKIEEDYAPYGTTEDIRTWDGFGNNVGEFFDVLGYNKTNVELNPSKAEIIDQVTSKKRVLSYDYSVERFPSSSFSLLIGMINSAGYSDKTPNIAAWNDLEFNLEYPASLNPHFVGCEKSYCVILTNANIIIAESRLSEDRKPSPHDISVPVDIYWYNDLDMDDVDDIINKIGASEIEGELNELDTHSQEELTEY